LRPRSIRPRLKGKQNNHAPIRGETFIGQGGEEEMGEKALINSRLDFSLPPVKMFSRFLKQLNLGGYDGRSK